MKGLEIDFETADRITILNMQEIRQRLIDDMNDYYNGGWLHPDDVLMNKQYIECLDVMIDFWGG